jgi:hypothetical protein
MKVRTLLACAGMLLTLAFGIAACGDDEGNANAGGGGRSADADSASTDVPKGWVEGKTPRGLADVAERLEDAGYTTSSPKGPRAQMLRVRMQEGGSVYVLLPDEPPSEREVASATKNSKGKLRAEIVGSKVFFANSGNLPLQAKAKLTEAQLDEFDKIVSLGRGGG